MQLLKLVWFPKIGLLKSKLRKLIGMYVELFQQRAYWFSV
jgi:hypothetical protein